MCTYVPVWVLKQTFMFSKKKSALLSLARFWSVVNWGPGDQSMTHFALITFYFDTWLPGLIALLTLSLIIIDTNL